MSTKNSPEVAVYSGLVLGRVVAALRKAKALDQTKIAAVVGITQSAYSRIETGTTDCTTEQLWLIAPGLGHSAARILRMVELAELQLAHKGVAIYATAGKMPPESALCPRDWIDAAAKVGASAGSA